MDQYRVLQFAPEGFLVLDAECRIRFGNAAAEQLCAARGTEWMGALLWQALPVGSPELLEASVRRAAAEQNSVEFVGRHEASGDEFRVTIFRAEDCLVVSLLDLEALQSTERALLAREAQLERVLVATGAAAFDLDLVTGETYLNAHFGELFGYREGEAPTDWPSYASHFDADDLRAAEAAAHQALLSGTSYTVDCHITRADGRSAWVRLRGDVMPNEEGRAIRSSGTVIDITAERERATALQESQRQLSAAQRLAGVGSWSWDIRTGAVAWSDEMFRILGYDVASVAASFELVTALAVDDTRREEFMARVQRSLEGESGYDFEMPMRRPDGQIRLLHTRGEVERDGSGAPIRMTGTAEDVTDRRAAVMALRRSEEELFRAQRMARIGSFVRSVETGSLWWSPMTRTILEIGDDEVPTLELALTRVPAEAADRYRQLAKRAAETGLPYEMESEAVVPSGRRLVLRLSGEVDRDAEGRTISIHGLLADITEQREQERALRESEVRFRTVWEASPIGIRLTDAQGKTLYVNPRALQMFACTEGEFLAERWRDHLHPDDRERVALEGRDAVQRERDKRVEYRVMRPDGRTIYVRATIAAVRAPDGRFAGHVGALEDLTEEVEARREKEMLEQQMHQAQKLESLGVLAGGIAHDFNNLLVGVLTNASMALMDLSPDAPAYETVRDIERAAQRAADLTRQLLAYSGKGRFIIEPLSLSELAVEMTQLLRTVVSKRATLQLDLHHELPLVRGDATQLRQVVMNLITNASDSLGESDGEITLRTTRQVLQHGIPDAISFGGPLAPGEYVVLEVADTGVGMEPATIQRIFDPFFTTKFTGRGLGLAATLGIVRGHDGAIGVRSRPGIGTSMSLYFPVSNGVRREAAAGLAAPLSGHGAILVVDDDDGVRAVARALLQRQGFGVILAANGQEAVAQFAAHRAEIRAVLLDLTMPVMGGEEALRRLREADPTVRVVLMSGYSDVDVEGTFASAGLSGFLQKPFRADDVYRTLTLALADS